MLRENRRTHGMERKESDFIKIMTTILDERSQRIMLGAYANCLGHGGVTALSRETGISRTTITAGQKEAKDIILSPEKYVVQKDGRIRTEGAGRKSVIENHPTIIDELYKLLDGNTVGNPENPLCWTTKSLRNLQESLNEKGIRVSHPTIGQLLEGMGFSLQQNKKYVESGDADPDRDTQFRFINDHAKEFMEQGYPVISVDTKKKELIGNYKNNGTEYRPKKNPLKVNDHDFMDKEKGKASPYGIYDIGRNEGFVNVGLSADTGAFAVNSIRCWWSSMGKERYPDTTKLMITADGGGSNGRRNRLWKTCLQEFANETGLEIYVSHFPPGTSKWNKIEHRLFSQISKNWRGRPLESLEIIVSLIGATTTKTGLTVKCVVDSNEYPKGVKIGDSQLASLNLTANDWHGEWNYVIAPQT